MELNDIDIVKSIGDGDVKAFDRVITKYSKLLWHISGKIISSGNPQDVEECVADVFIYLWENSDKFDPEKGSLRNWLTVIAKSRALNKLKEISRHSTLSLDENAIADSFELEGMIVDRETAEILVAAVKNLKYPDRDIIIRKYCYEEQTSKIAHDLELSEKSVEGRLYRIRLRLKNLIT